MALPPIVVVGALYRTRRRRGLRDAQGNLTGLGHETVFYDPDALVEPIRIVRRLNRTGGLDSGTPYNYLHCVQTIYPLDGVPTPVPPGRVIPFQAPDMYGRPWAQSGSSTSSRA